MEFKNFNLDKFRKPLEESLRKYENFFGEKLTFNNFPDFYLTSEKPNFARTAILVSYNQRMIGEMCVIAFLQGDGTGDSKTYKLNELIIPKEMEYSKKQERILPGAKKGIVCEGYFPLFSINKSGREILNAGCLEELTIKKDSLEIAPAWHLGQGEEKYIQALNFGLEKSPEVFFTTGKDSQGNRFGDPHSIYYKIKEEAIQVAGFLSIKNEDNLLMNLTKKWILPQE